MRTWSDAKKPFKLSELAGNDGKPHLQGPQQKKPVAVLINEYDWLWLTRDGNPTCLTDKVYESLLGKNSTIEQRRKLHDTLIQLLHRETHGSTPSPSSEPRPRSRVANITPCLRRRHSILTPDDLVLIELPLHHPGSLPLAVSPISVNSNLDRLRLKRREHQTTIMRRNRKPRDHARRTEVQHGSLLDFACCQSHAPIRPATYLCACAARGTYPSSHASSTSTSRYCKVLLPTKSSTTRNPHWNIISVTHAFQSFLDRQSRPILTIPQTNALFETNDLPIPSHTLNGPTFEQVNEKNQTY